MRRILPDAGRRTRIPSRMTKADLIHAIRAELRAGFERLSQAAREAHAAATDPGSKAESKYDTRSLEASYLAAGQARQVEELAEAMRRFENWEPDDFDIDDPIGPGALVETNQNGEPAWFFLVPAAGGLTVEYEGGTVTLITPESPLHHRLVGLRTGDTVDHPPLTVTEVL